MPEYPWEMPGLRAVLHLSSSSRRVQKGPEHEGTHQVPSVGYLLTESVSNECLLYAQQQALGSSSSACPNSSNKL